MDILGLERESWIRDDDIRNFPSATTCIVVVLTDTAVVLSAKRTEFTRMAHWQMLTPDGFQRGNGISGEHTKHFIQLSINEERFVISH